MCSAKCFRFWCTVSFGGFLFQKEPKRLMFFYTLSWVITVRNECCTSEASYFVFVDLPIFILSKTVKQPEPIIYKSTRILFYLLLAESCNFYAEFPFLFARKEICTKLVIAACCNHALSLSMEASARWKVIIFLHVYCLLKLMAEQSSWEVIVVSFCKRKGASKCLTTNGSDTLSMAYHS